MIESKSKPSESSKTPQKQEVESEFKKVVKRMLDTPPHPIREDQKKKPAK